MKKIYICGDSFCVKDPEFGPCWVDYLEQVHNVITIAQVAATNLMISMQVDHAIAASADFIIVHATSCTRGQTKIQDQIVPYSYLTASTTTTPFDAHQLTILKQYFTEFFNLELAIYENKCIIENTLQRLVESGTPFVFSQGGFEHVSFGNNTKYFEKFNKYRSKINLWDYSTSRNYRPYYHINDNAVHRTISDYYIEVIE